MAGTKLGADESNDLLGNILRLLQVAGVSPIANRYDDLLDALDNLYKGVSEDTGNVLLVGVDGKPLLTADPAPGNLLKATSKGLLVEVAASDVQGLAEVATSGKYEDLIDPPTIPPAQVNADWNAAGGVERILNKPPIPAAQVNADWNATGGIAQILNKPSQLTALPVLTIELGNNVQANGGLGIDMGSWYQLDFHIGVTTANGFQYTVNSDGTMQLNPGVYLVCGNPKVLSLGTDVFTMPAQITLATGQNYAFPGVYQYAVQSYPLPSIFTITSAGPFGSIPMCGTISSWASGTPTWLGFSKVISTGAKNPLHLQGFLSYIKVG